MKRVFIISIIYCILLYILSLCLVIFQGTLPKLLPGTAISYRLQISLLHFCTFLPSVLITSYIPESYDTGFIFYPGGKVESTSYEVLMYNLASKGILCA